MTRAPTRPARQHPDPTGIAGELLAALESLLPCVDDDSSRFAARKAAARAVITKARATGITPDPFTTHEALNGVAP